MPGFVITPASIGTPLSQSPSRNSSLASSYEGQLLLDDVKMAVNGLSSTTTRAAKVAAVSRLGFPSTAGPPVLKTSFHHLIMRREKRLSANMASSAFSYAAFGF